MRPLSQAHHTHPAGTRLPPQASATQRAATAFLRYLSYPGISEADRAQVERGMLGLVVNPLAPPGGAPREGASSRRKDSSATGTGENNARQQQGVR